jgi:hypothetical protein
MLLQKIAKYAKENSVPNGSGVEITELSPEMIIVLESIKDMDGEAPIYELDVDNQEIYFCDNNGDEITNSRISVDDMFAIINANL